jgi:hypothetical protein
MMITPQEWSNVAKGDQKDFLGAKLYDEISNVHPQHAPKLTGMFLEMKNEDIIDLLNRPKRLKAEIQNAFAQLNTSTTASGAACRAALQPPAQPPAVAALPTMSPSGSGVVEKVKTNQRGLITKILSRYATDFFSLKELIQNADDAQSSEVEVMLWRDPDGQFGRLAVRNNGRAFSSEDWDRIRTIASGNPNEQTVGYFGVGFFSVFAHCDTPYLESGHGSMKFFWGEGGELYTEKNELPQLSPATTFVLNLKPNSDARTWDLHKVESFLTKALCFPKHLQTIKLLIDDVVYLNLSRTIQPAPTLPIPDKLQRSSPNNVFEVAAMAVHQLIIGVVRADGSTDSLLLHLVEVVATVCNTKSVKKLKAALSEVLMKKIPNQTTIQLLYEQPPSTEQLEERIALKSTAREHAMANEGPKPSAQKKVMLMHKGGGADPAAEGGAVAVTAAAGGSEEAGRLRTLLSPVNGDAGTSSECGCGLIFIGFETHQSTGFGFHVNAQVGTVC